MTFEEFFTKKKIDLVELEKAEPSLYAEFKSHFSAMGEKSFDHTKKFWFNKLRRLYHLTPPDKAITQVETAIASQAEPLSSPTIEQKPSFTPRFKSANIQKTEPASEEQAEANPATPKPAFKPRNIPVKPAEPANEPKAVRSAEQPEPKPVARPAFKPRNIPSKATESSEKPAPDSSEEQQETKPVAKPAFRPRNIPSKASEVKTEETPAAAPNSDTPVVKTPGFKPRNIKRVADENAVDANRADSRPGHPAVSETPVTNPGKQEEAAKEGYKPKFKLKNIPRNPAAGEEQTGQPVKQELVPDSLPGIQTDSPVESDIERKISSSAEEKTPEQEIQDNNLDLRGSDDEKPEEKPAGGYKPKFKLKNIKPKSED